jgi:putative ABC transport system permease protein
MLQRNSFRTGDVSPPAQESTVNPVAARWQAVRESGVLALDALRGNPARSALAVLGIVVGIVTVSLVATVLVNVRNQIALLFRELGTDNVFAFHLSGDPYQPASDEEARRQPLERGYAEVIARNADAVLAGAAQILVPPVINGRALSARVGSAVSDTVLVEGASAGYFDIVGAELAHGRPFTELEDRAGARVAVLGASLARALFGAEANDSALGREVVLAGEPYVVVGLLAQRRGGFFGENRQDSVLAIPAGTAVRRFPDADATVLYLRSEPGRLQEALIQTETALRQLRGLSPEESSDFNLSTSEQIISTFDRVGAGIALATVGLAAVSLVIGGIGVANVMIIGVTERTREIGVRRAVGARREDVLRQFLIESVLLSLVGGVAGLVLAGILTALLALVLPGFVPVLPAWALLFGLGSSCLTGVLAGYLPAREAAALDPVDSLRYEAG